MNLIESELNRFDEKFDHFNEDKESGKRICNGDCEINSDLEDVKSFIKQSLERVLDKAIESLPEEWHGEYTDTDLHFGFNQALQQAKDNINKLKE